MNADILPLNPHPITFQIVKNSILHKLCKTFWKFAFWKQHVSRENKNTYSTNNPINFVGRKTYFLRIFFSISWTILNTSVKFMRYVWIVLAVLYIPPGTLSPCAGMLCACITQIFIRTTQRTNKKKRVNKISIFDPSSRKCVCLVCTRTRRVLSKGCRIRSVNKIEF
jgi:hypothetical protein